MKYVFYGKKMDISEALKQRAIKKLGKLEKFFHADTEAVIAMSVEKNRHIVEVTIPTNGMLIRAEVESSNMYSSIDKTVDKLEGQIRRHKTRLEKRHHGVRKSGHAAAATPVAPPDLSAFAASAASAAAKAADDIFEEDEFIVARSKKFSIKPMTVDEAILQMNLLDHVFFVFRNEETSNINVVYMRKNGDYGLLEPEE